MSGGRASAPARSRWAGGRRRRRDRPRNRWAGGGGPRRGVLALALLLPWLPLAGGCGGGGSPGETVDVHVPEGASARAVADLLHEAGLVEQPFVFRVYLKITRAERGLKAGHYRFRGDAGWGEIVDRLTRGEVVRLPLTVPEGFELREIAPRVAAMARVTPDSVLALMGDSGLVASWGLPGPTMEGYLFPETYYFAEGVPPRSILRAMVDRYQAFWGAEERRLADSLGMSEREVVTLASIVEKEARVPEERTTIAGVFHNRLRIGMLLQADPTVQYALPERRSRLLFRDIDAVADDPYNTYTRPGLPPGPIASPGDAALRAVLQPADVPYLFFVAEIDGSHYFSRTEREHNNARIRIRAERERLERSASRK